MIEKSDRGDWNSAVSQIGTPRRGDDVARGEPPLSARAANASPLFLAAPRHRFARKIPVRRFHFLAFRVPLD